MKKAAESCRQGAESVPKGDGGQPDGGGGALHSEDVTPEFESPRSRINKPQIGPRRAAPAAEQGVDGGTVGAGVGAMPQGTRASSAATQLRSHGSPKREARKCDGDSQAEEVEMAAKKKKQRETIGGTAPAPQPKPKKQKKTSRGK